MDKHVELSYCSFEAFKVPARQELSEHGTAHPLFPKISESLGEANMTTADIAEHLTDKTIMKDARICLDDLILALQKTMEESSLAAEKGKREEIIS